MAKATPEELAMHQLAEKEVDETTEKLLSQPEPEIPTALEPETPVEAPKRKRGRPSNAEKVIHETIAATADGAANKPGPKPAKKTGGKTADPALLGKQLVGIHALAAMFTQLPELQLSEQEGEQLGAAIINVCDQYSLSVDGKTGAAIQLLAAAAMIYAPRAFMIKRRLEEQRKVAEQTPMQPNEAAFYAAGGGVPGN